MRIKAKIKAALKEWIFQLTHHPESPAGLRHRAQKLIDKGTDPNHPYILAMLKLAELKEEKQHE